MCEYGRDCLEKVCEGIGSRGHVVGWLERRSLDTSASVRGQKEKMGV